MLAEAYARTTAISPISNGLSFGARKDRTRNDSLDRALDKIASLNAATTKAALAKVARKTLRTNRVRTLDPSIPGLCYLNALPKTLWAGVARVFEYEMTRSHLLLLLQTMDAARPRPNYTVNLRIDGDHLERAPPGKRQTDLLVRWLSTPGKESTLVGAPRAHFSNALDVLGGTIHKDAVLDNYTQPTVNAINDSMRWCPNAIPEPNFSLLAGKGLPVDVNATGSHPHPAAKAVEEDLLRTLSFSLRDDTTVYFMKQEKFNRLQANQPRFSHLVNPVLSARDTVRFTPGYQRLSTPPSTPTVFLHDVGHYLSCGEVARLFDEFPAMQRLMFSAILPEEVMLGEPSWHPSLYRLEHLDADSYSYILSEDGESYEQPYSTLEWLTTKSITAPAGRLSVEVIHRKFSHKLFVVTRAEALVPRDWWVCDSPDDVVLPHVDGRILRHSSQRVPRTIFQSVLLHSMSLSTQRLSSTIAKVRTFSSNPQYSHIDADTWVALAQTCYAMSLEPASLEREAPFNSYAAFMLRRLRRFMHSHDWLLPFLVGGGFAISWGSLLLPVLGIRIPDWHVRSGLKIPGWSYGAVAAAMSQVALCFFEGKYSSAVYALRAAAVAIPHLAYLLPDFTLRSGFTVPSFVGGLGLSFLTAVTISFFDGVSPHYEVHDFVARLPHRDQRRWRLRDVRIHREADVLWWEPLRSVPLEPENDDIPPAYSSDPLPEDAEYRPFVNVPFFNLWRQHVHRETVPLTFPRDTWSINSTTGTGERLPYRSVHVSEASSSSGSTSSGDPPTDADDVSMPGSATSSNSLDFATLPSIDTCSLLRCFRDGDSAGATTESSSFPQPQPPHDAPSFTFTDNSCVAPSPVVSESAVPLGPSGADFPPSRPHVNLGATPTAPPPREGVPLRLQFDLGAAAVLEPDDLFSCDPPEDSTVLPYPLNDCLLRAIENTTGVDRQEVWRVCCRVLPRAELEGPEVDEGGLTTLCALAFAYEYRCQFHILGDLQGHHPEFIGVSHPDFSRLNRAVYNVYFTPGHWSSGPEAPLRGSAPPPHTANVQPAHRRPTRFEQALVDLRDHRGSPLFQNWYSYTTSPARAKPYVRDLKAGTTGTMRSNEGKDRVPKGFTASLDSMVDNHRPRQVLCAAILGAPGCAKSTSVRALLRQAWTQRGNTWKVSVPRVKLRKDWVDRLALGKLSFKVGTFETSMHTSAKCLIVDEVSQFPPGYIDACLIKDSTITSVLIIGDVTQGGFHESDCDSTLNSSGCEALYFRNFCSLYRNYSFSIPRAVSNAIGLPTASSTRGSIQLVTRADPRWPIVCASNSEVAMYSSQGFDAYSFGTVQGQRFEQVPIQIVISNATALLVSRGHFVSALCRSNVGVRFLFAGTHQAVMALQSEPFYASLFSARPRMSYTDLFREELRGLTLSQTPGFWDPLNASDNPPPIFTARQYPNFTLFRGASSRSSRIDHRPALPEVLSADAPGCCWLQLLDEEELPDLKPPHTCMTAQEVLDFVAREGVLLNEVDLFVPSFSHNHPYSNAPGGAMLHLRVNTRGIQAQELLRRLVRSGNGHIPMGADATELPIDRASLPLQALLSAPPDFLPTSTEHDDNMERGPPTGNFVEDEEFLLLSFGELPDRSPRESYTQFDQSQQFRDDPWYQSNPSASNLEQVFPRHRGDDLVTFARTVEKRLRFAPRHTNLSRFHDRLFVGPILYNGWLRATGITHESIPPFDADLYAQCILENEFTKLTNKTQATLLNNADRADPDWRHTFVRIFMKSQLKVKLETILSPFKAGQTLASFQDSVILVTGPMTRYLVHQSERLFRPQYYHHPGHSPLALSTWCQKHWKSRPLNSTNDYTAFDQSQTGEALSFELMMLRAFGIPDGVISYYTELKLELTCQFGELAVMRFTGEGPTLWFNGCFNTALVGVQYDFPSDTAIAVAGDDLAMNGVFPERPGWQFLRRYLTIEAKPETVKTASFCSWLLTPHGAIKEPRVVFAKLMIARDRGEEAKSLPNLLNEVAVGYHLGDHVYEHLDDLSLATHFWLIRYFVRKAPHRFALLLTTRSIEEVLAHIWHLVEQRTRTALRELDARFGQLWMLHSRPARLAASVLSRVRGSQLSGLRVFDHTFTRLYTH